MNKILPVFFVFAFLQSSLWAQSPKVKSLDFKDFTLDETDYEGKLKMLKREYKEYDGNGRLTKKVEYQVSDATEPMKISELVKNYEDDTRTEELTKYEEAGTGKRIFYEKSTLNAKNKCLRLEYIDFKQGEDARYVKTYEYTEIGKPLSITLLDADEKKIGEEKWKYNRNDEEVEFKKWEKRSDGSKYDEKKKTSYNKDGTLDQVVTEIKDGDDKYKEEILFERNRVKEQFKYKNGDLVSQFGGTAKKTTYDPSKAKTMMDFGYGDDGLGFGMFSTEDELDDQGRKIKTIERVDEDVISQITYYSYDDRNNIIEVKKVSYEGEMETEVNKEVSEYDKYNNLIRTATYLDDFLMSEKTYDYQYHP